jgi:plasmid stabilization system protein ParE
MGGVRRLVLYKIRYYLYYRLSGDTVDVLALWHTSRGEGPAL